MTHLRRKWQTGITLLFIVLICVGQIMIPLHAAYAGLPVIDAGDIAQNTISAVENTMTAANTSHISVAADAIAVSVAQGVVIQAKHEVEFNLEEWVLKPAVRVLILALIRTMTGQIVAWITGDGGRNVGFVNNLENEAIKEADRRGGEFLNRLTGINLCSANLRDFVKANLSLPGYNNLNPQLACTITGIKGNVDNFYRDFNNGGWTTFVSIAANPQNNGFGATLIAQANFEAAKNAAVSDSQKKLEIGKGFKGVQLTKLGEKCEWSPINKTRECYNTDVATTPGGIINDQLSKSLYDAAGINFANNEVAGVIDAALTTIITTMVSTVIQKSHNLF